MRYRALIAAMMLTTSTAGGAEVVGASAGHFELRSVAATSASPAAVYAALGQPSAWWNPAHSYSGNAASLALDLRAGGCFCEAATGDFGSIEHMRVVQARPGAMLRMRAVSGRCRARL